MSGWKTLSSKVVYETAWIKVLEDKVLNQVGKPLTYSYIKLQNPSVFVVAIDNKGEVLMQQVFRYTVGQRIWEIPAGYTNPGEEPIAAGKRELLEETGYTSNDWIHLGRIQQILGIGDVGCDVVLARNVKKEGDFTDKEEDIENRMFKSMSTIEAMIADNILIDGPVIAAIYKAKLYTHKENR